jgi:hypothetical protein
MHHQQEAQACVRLNEHAPHLAHLILSPSRPERVKAQVVVAAFRSPGLGSCAGWPTPNFKLPWKRELDLDVRVNC